MAGCSPTRQPGRRTETPDVQPPRHRCGARRLHPPPPLVSSPPSRPALAAHARSVQGARLGADAAADAGVAGGGLLRTIPPPLSDHGAPGRRAAAAGDGGVVGAGLLRARAQPARPLTRGHTGAERRDTVGYRGPARAARRGCLYGGRHRELRARAARPARGHERRARAGARLRAGARPAPRGGETACLVHRRGDSPPNGARHLDAQPGRDGAGGAGVHGTRATLRRVPRAHGLRHVRGAARNRRYCVRRFFAWSSDVSYGRSPGPVYTCRGRAIFCSLSSSISSHWASHPAARGIANSTVK